MARQIADSELLAALAERLSAGGVSSDVNESTVAELWPRYERAERSEVSSWNTKEGRMRLHVLPHFGALRPGQVDLEAVDVYREKRLAQYTNRKGPDGLPKHVSRTSVNRELEDLRRLLSWAKHRKLIAANPLADVERGELFTEEDNVRRSVIEEPVLEEILHAARDVLGDHYAAFRAFLLIDVDGGMRREEIATLTWPQVDAAAGIIKVWWSKTDEQRETILSERALEALRILRLEQPEGSKFVFAHGTAHFHKDTFSGWMKRVCVRGGVEGPDGSYCIHDGRRTFSTVLARAGVSMGDAMSMTGHTTPSTYLRYNITGRQSITRAKERVDAYMKDAVGKNRRL